QRKAGVDHGGELAGEDRHLPFVDPSPPLEGDPGRGLLRDLGDEDRATPQLTYRGRAVGRLDLPVLHPVGGTTLIDEDSHRVSLLGGLPSAKWRAARRGGGGGRGRTGRAEQPGELLGKGAAVQRLFAIDPALLYELGQ